MEGLEVLARMTSNKIQFREIVSHWILIVYDIPHTEAGDKARQQFLIAASAIGATRHTDSCYILPDSPEAQLLALNLAKTEGSEVICWGHAEPLNYQEEITASYDQALKPKLKEISSRLDKMAGYRVSNHQKRLLRMVPKTERLIQNVEAAIERRGAEVLAMWLEILKTRFAQIVSR